MEGKKKHDNKKINYIFKEIVKMVFALIIAFGTGFIDNITDKIFSESDQKVYQQFVNEESLVEYVGIEYVQCELTASPLLEGYQVKPYPYICCGTSEKQIYIPICQQFTQTQYSANKQGKCRLIKEDLNSDLNDLIYATFENTDIKSEMGCLIVIQYTSETNETITEAYELKNGMLTYADKETCSNVINETVYKTGYKIKTEEFDNASVILEQVKKKLL